ncbi:hypothetical protein, partial [uncultured Bacteroides sp.]|uniref:hypothetical protein n=1 Tax=uncultured Bacteroides sp. TaxID=162156 RepID=UPI00262DB03B
MTTDLFPPVYGEKSVVIRFISVVRVPSPHSFGFISTQFMSLETMVRPVTFRFCAHLYSGMKRTRTSVNCRADTSSGVSTPARLLRPRGRTFPARPAHYINIL